MANPDLENKKSDLKLQLKRLQLKVGTLNKVLTGINAQKTNPITQSQEKQNIPLEKAKVTQEKAAAAQATMIQIKDVKDQISILNTEISNLDKEEANPNEANPNEVKTEQKKMAKLNKQDIVRLLESQEPARMTKRDLVESISNLILIKEGMHRDVRRKIDSGDNDYAGHLDPETVKRMADDLMGDISNNLQNKMGGRGQVNQDAAQRVLYQGLGNALQKEGLHKNELEQLAVRLVMEEFDIPEGSVEFDARITGQEPIRKTGLKMSKGNKRPPQGKTEEELKPNVTKRRLMNAMMHGAARKGQNLFHMAAEELNRIDPSLVDSYSKIMAGNDFMYWSTDDETLKRESEGGTHAGQVEVRLQSKPPKIVAQGMTFPFLLHELTKGVLELISSHGREADPEHREYVEDKTDNLESESWDVRLGPKLWEKFMEALDIDDLPNKTHIFNEFTRLPPNEFNSIVQGLLNGTDEAKEAISDIAHDIRREMGEDDLEDSLSQFRDTDSGEEGGEEGTMNPGDDEDQEDPILKGLLSKNDEPEVDDMDNWSKRELENARDEALDSEDYGLVRQIQNILDKKY